MSVPRDSTCPPRCVGFLGLTPTTRELIYLYAGIITNSTIPLDKENSIELVTRRGMIEALRGPRHDWATTLALLRTCRPVYTEVSALTYSMNRFVTHDLRPLRNLTPSSLRSLSELKTHVHAKIGGDERRCRPGHDYCGLLYSAYNTGKLLDSSNSADTRIIEEWAVTAAHIGSNIQAGTLVLSLICDVENLETANLVLAPLHQWPQLARCSIRLSNWPNSVLSDLARATSRALMHSQDAEVFPRYQGLPTELRLNILQYTDLVTPWTEVTWTPGCRYLRKPRYSYKPFTCCEAGIREYRIVNGDSYITAHAKDIDGTSDWTLSFMDYRVFGHAWEPTHYACQFRACSRMKIWYSGTGCLCRKYHAAYSPTCTCWEPPTSLFLVSKSFHQEAALTFFSSNHFSFNFGICADRQVRTASYFLRGLVSTSLFQHLKSLTIGFEYNWIDRDDFEREVPTTACQSLLSLFPCYRERLILRRFEPFRNPDFKARLEWMGTTDLINSVSSLRYMEIRIQIDDEIFTELADWESLDVESLFGLARRAIQRRYWPLLEKGPPQGVRQLMVCMYFRPPRWSMWYNIREEHEALPDEKRYWGNHPDKSPRYQYVSHHRSLEVQEDNSVATWIENIWVTG